MSVEIRVICDRPERCDMGIPRPSGYDDWCHHRMECDWGIIENSEADPRRGIKHLVLVTGDVLRRLLDQGSEPNPRGGLTSATYDGERFFMHLDYNGQHWTWQLFAAHFDDHKGPDDLLIGRWPD